jgi:hypothetical protein
VDVVFDPPRRAAEQAVNSRPQAWPGWSRCNHLRRDAHADRRRLSLDRVLQVDQFWSPHVELVGVFERKALPLPRGSARGFAADRSRSGAGGRPRRRFGIVE